MKYKDLIQFEPINEVVKFNRLQEDDYRRSLVQNFVFSAAYEKTIIPEICKQLDYTASYDTFGLQIVGNYGTGKSHLMSLVSLIAENADYLPLVQNESARKVLSNISGKYKVVRFEMGSTDELWDIVCHHIDGYLNSWSVNYSIKADKSADDYKKKLSRLMAHFEEAFPDKGLMIVVDEMLEYLKGRATDDRLARDLSVLRALGEASDHSRFRMVFGVQELIYKVPQFRFAAETLDHANDRYIPIPITKQDVQYVVQQRLLHKSENQKNVIRQHLSKFTGFFTDMHSKFDDYVNLFPVNPSFFDNFQQIRIAKSQREVMKTLTKKFSAILDQDVPETQPGLICYDHYWEDLNVPAMMTDPDVRRVAEIMEIIHKKIDDNFTGLRQKKAPLAHRIANACAVKILQESLEKTNGASTENLVDDLCYLDSGCMDRDFLIDIIDMTAKQIVTATVGQYFEKNDTNQEYHLRIEGGVNYEQKIKDYITTMNEDKKDQYFFNYLVEYLPIQTERYRREFRIFRHSIDWKSHKTMLNGYIFMGNPNERSTTQPQQSFYIYFMPIFNKANIRHGEEADSIYVHMEKVSDEMKELLELYAAAEEQIASVDSSQKPFYEQFKKSYVEKLKPVFQRDFLQCTEIVYQGEVQPINPQMMTGDNKEQVISNIASALLEDHFCNEMPDYPKFTLLRAPLTSGNRAIMLKSARQKIANPTDSNRDGEAILAGLGLLQNNQLSVEGCQYALSIKAKLDAKGEGQVLNRDEILHRFYKKWDSDWRSNDFHIDADLEFLVLAAMVAVGEIEIDMPGGKNINAANLREIVDLSPEAFYSFSHIRAPKGMNVAAVRELFLGITGKDMTAQLQNQEIYTELVSKGKAIAASAVKLGHEIANGIYLENIEIMARMDALSLKNQLDALAGLCDKLPSYASPAKMRNLPWPVDAIKGKMAVIKTIGEVRNIMTFVSDFRARMNYLTQAKQYMTEEQMIQKVDVALNKIKDIIAVMTDEQKVNAYKAELDALMGEYADWYLKEYNRLHITGMQDADRRKLLNSNEKKVCDIICGADHDRGYFSVATQYAEWGRKIASLTMGSTSVNRDAILRVPYQGFNPVQFAGKQLPDLGKLKDELDSIYHNVDDTLHAILRDKELLKNKEILDDSQQALLERFNNQGEELSPINAERLVEIVMKLHEGIHKIPITMDTLRTHLNRPMTPDEAIKAFKNLINIASNGNKGDNVRIIFK